MTITPERKHGIVNRATNTFFDYQGWPSVCKDENGVLYAVASGMRMRHVCPFGKTVMYISRNNGETWTPPIIVNDDYLDDRDAGILYMGGGRMLVSWFSHPANSYLEDWLYNTMVNHVSDDKRALMKGMLDSYGNMADAFQDGGSCVRISEDYGVTWSKRILVPVSAPHGPTLLHDGSLLYLGMDYGFSRRKKAEDGGPGVPCAYISRDGGYTWEKRANIQKPDGVASEAFHEPHAIELPDGRILGMIRAQGPSVTPDFTIYTTESADGGYTWTMPAGLGICGSPPHLMLHASGALICSFGRRAEPYSQRALVSYDYGKTWADEYIIDECAPCDMGYPASVELEDGSILTVYYQPYQGDKNCSILYTKWKLK